MGSEPRQTGGPGAIGRIQVIRGYPPPEAQQNSGLIWLRGSWVDLAWDHPAFIHVQSLAYKWETLASPYPLTFFAIGDELPNLWWNQA